MLSLAGAIFLGWSLGANDAANVFGTAVSSRMIRFGTAAAVASVFVVLGAAVSGRFGIETLKGLTSMNLDQAVVVSVAAAATVTLMTVLGLPVSTSQAVVGAIVGIGLLNGRLNLAGLGKVGACWLGTPVGGALCAIMIYRFLGYWYNRAPVNIFQADQILRWSMLVAGAYGAYALGANNVANVTAVFVGAGLLDTMQAALIGGFAIALGVITFSRPVMETVGNKLVRLDPFSALVVVLAQAVTVHLYTCVGVPVSTSQAVIGAVLGIGLVKGMNTVSAGTLKHILLAWFISPAVSCCLALAIDFGIHLRYVPGP